MKTAILTDFGSTYTKVVVVSMEDGNILLSEKFHSTVKTDAKIGLFQCFEAAKTVISEEDFQNAVKLSSSSAAGGLRMGVIGISPTLSITAGKNAVYGAGAKILWTCSGKLTNENLESIQKSNCEIILFCGGYENGNQNTLLHNAKMLSKSSINCPIIYAGNSRIAHEVRLQLLQRNKECFMAPNIIPEVGKLNTKPVEEIIRTVFLKRIINMKGLDSITNFIDAVVMPTPAAVLKAGELLAKGAGDDPGIGPCMIVDIGGATTDIHSFGEPKAYEDARCIGAEEPFAKRTVEGDLGLRESSNTLLSEVGAGYLATQTGVTEDNVRSSVQSRIDNIHFLGETPYERSLDLEIACCAAKISARRHAGYIQHALSKGSSRLQIGKNLTEVHTIIGTGGPIINCNKPECILEKVLLLPEESKDILLPDYAKFYLDKDYAFYAAGLLSTLDEKIALKVMKKSIKKL